MTERASPAADDSDDEHLSESQLQARIMIECDRLGLLCFHTYSGNVSRAGFPDLVIAGPGGVLFWELKGETGLLNFAQGRWARMLRCAGEQYAVITPRMWADGTVRDVLRALLARVAA